MRLLIAAFLLCYSLAGCGQSLGPGISLGSNVSVGTVPSLFPTPPAGASQFTDAQSNTALPGSWTICQGSCTGAVSTTGNGTVTTGNTDISLSGSSVKITDTQLANSTGSNAPGWDVLAYRKFGCSLMPGATCVGKWTMYEDMWIYNVSTTNLTANEIDPDLYDGTRKYFPSMQCRLIGTGAGYWFEWSSAADAWQPTTYPCTASTVAAGSWHHVQLLVTIDTTAQTYTYITFAFDGAAVFKNASDTFNSAPLVGTPSVDVEFEVDNNGNAPGDPGFTNTEYGDKINLWVWPTS